MLKNRSKAVPFFILLFIAICVLSASAALSTSERAESYYKQGYLYYAEKNYNLAIGEYDKALELDNTLAKAYYWRGKSYYMLGDTDKAKPDIDRALELSPNFDNWSTLQSKVKPALKPAPKPVKKTDTAIAPEPPKAEGPDLISIDLRAVDISHAFSMLSKETGQNIVVREDVHGKITLSLSNVTTTEAFDAILNASNCTFEYSGNVIRIIPSGEPKKISYLPNGDINKTYTINYVKPEDLAATLTTLLPSGTKIITTPGSNSIIIEGIEDAINKADDTIANLDVPPKQVMVEARIIELTNTNGSALGVNMSYTDPNNPTSILQTKGLAGPPTASTATGLYYSVSNQNITALLEALSATTGYDLLSAPKVMAVSGKSAEILTGEKLGYTVKTITDTGLVESVEFLDVGTKLDFTANIKDDGFIVMDIHPEISEGSIVNDLPQKNSTETTTQLLVKDGETIIIGGLMKDQTQKVNTGVPFLQDIPFIGVPFRRVALTTERREIMVLISPHIATADMLNNMKPAVEDIQKRQDEERKVEPIDLIR